MFRVAAAASCLWMACREWTKCARREKRGAYQTKNTSFGEDVPTLLGLLKAPACQRSCNTLDGRHNFRAVEV